MLGLEPGDEAGGLVVLDFAKAQERAHLVDVAPYPLGQRVEPPHQRIGAVLDQPALAAKPEEQGIEQREPLGIARHRDAAGQVEERARHRKAGRCDPGGGRGKVVRAGKQVGRLAADLPHHVVGWDALGRKHARRIAPAVEIIGFGKGDDAHE